MDIVQGRADLETYLESIVLMVEPVDE